ncbi:MAG: hypothetical protein ACYCVH_05185 [Ignavibacteriaceae bacterium]
MKKDFIALVSRFSILVSVLFSFTFFNSCEVTSPFKNLAPYTTIANIPVQGDTISPPILTFNWDGHDNDGYIQGCKYRYITFHLIKGDSIVHDWQTTSSGTIQIILESSDIINKQVIQISSINNRGIADPNSAQLIVYTKKAIPPRVSISTPNNNQNFFVLNKTNDWWQGIPLTFSGYDPDDAITEYGYSVDGGNLVWTRDTTVFIPPNMFSTPIEGEHTIQVTARDSTNLLDSAGVKVIINLIKPNFSKKGLIITETDAAQFPASYKITEADVDSFYNDIFNSYDFWNFVKNGLPPKYVLGNYKIIIWNSDNPPTIRPNAFAQYQETLKEYLNAGGSLILSGWRVLKSFGWANDFPMTFKDGTFVHDYLHINTADESPYLPPDFQGAHGVEGYNDMMLDPNKSSYIFHMNKLSRIDVITSRGGFTKTIYSYLGSNIDFIGRPCGILYFGTVYKAAVFGFPLFFMKKDDVKLMVGKLLNEMGQ